MLLYTFHKHFNGCKSCPGVKVFTLCWQKGYGIGLIPRLVLTVSQATLCVGASRMSTPPVRKVTLPIAQIWTLLTKSMLWLPLEEDQDLSLCHALGVPGSFCSLALGRWLICTKAEARTQGGGVGMASGYHPHFTGTSRIIPPYPSDPEGQCLHCL